MNEQITDSTIGFTPTLQQIEQVEAKMLNLPQVEMPLTHIFAPGIYWREMLIPKGTFAIGHQHKTEHLNVILSGKLRVLVDGRVEELIAPMVFKSGAGVRKMAFALEDTRMVNIHHNPTNEQDMDKLEEIFVQKSAAYLHHADEIQLLKGTPK